MLKQEKGPLTIHEPNGMGLCFIYVVRLIVTMRLKDKFDTSLAQLMIRTFSFHQNTYKELFYKLLPMLLLLLLFELQLGFNAVVVAPQILGNVLRNVQL
jgi:hypothetical protein